MASLLTIFYQDQKERLVYGWLFGIAGIAFAGLHFVSAGWFQFIIHVGFAMGMILVLFLVLSIYIQWRTGSFAMQSALGMGDILLILSLGLGFGPVHFMILLVFGLLFSLILHMTLQSVHGTLIGDDQGIVQSEHEHKSILQIYNTDMQEQMVSDTPLEETVPLAGYLALFFSMVMPVQWIGWYTNLYIL